MKKSLFILLAVWAAAAALVSCNDSDGDYPRYNPLITTVHTLDRGDYYFQRDNDETLYPEDKSRVPGYEPRDGQRAIIWFNRLPESAASEGYTYNIALYYVQELYTAETRIVDDAAELGKLGDDPVTVRPEGCNLTPKWLTLYVNFSAVNASKHDFALVVNRTPGAAAGDDSDYLGLELRHNARRDAGYIHGDYISFDLAPVAELLDGKKGISLRVKSRNTPEEIRYIRFDLPQGQQ